MVKSKTCPQCRATIPAAAHLCKVCGKRFDALLPADADFPMNSKQGNSNFLIGLVVLSLVLIGTTLLPDRKSASEPGGASKNPGLAQDAGPYANADRQALWIAKSQEAVLARLRDPASAEFRNVHFYSGSGAPIVCGEVNARNGFGGYIGFVRFIAKGSGAPAVLESDMASPAEMTRAWNELCVKAPGDSQ